MFSEYLTVKKEHIDFQGILDGQHYLYYYEKVRHNFFTSLGKSLEDYFSDGIIVVLTSIESLNYKKSINVDDNIEITCELVPVSKAKFGFYQKMLVDGKIVSDAKFIATAVNSTGGRPFIPATVQKVLDNI